MDFKEFSEGTGSLKPGWMLKKDPELAKKLKDQQDRKKFVAGEPTKKEVKEDMEKSHAPVAPVPDKKYIKGTPENKAYKATKKPINGHPTNMKEEVKTTHENPLVVVKDQNGHIYTHANLSVANAIHQANVKHQAIHTGKPVKAGKFTFELSKHHAKEVKEETMPQSFKGFLTSLNELTDKQKKHIDKNKNGQIDAHDFKLLRKEEEVKPVNESHFDVGDSVVCKDSKTKGKVVKVDPKEEGKYYTVKHADGKMVKYSPDELKLENYYMEELDEALDPSEVAGNPKMYDAATVKKAYYHKKTTPEDKKTLERHLDRHHGQHDWRNSVKEDLEEAMSPQQDMDFKKMMSGAMSRAEYNAKHKKPLKPTQKVIYGKNVKEDTEELDEKSDQAKRNKTMKNMMDASRGAKFKLNNPVPEADPQHKTAQAHNKAIGRALRNESTKAEDPPFDGPYKKVSGDGSVKDKSGAVHTPMSRARDLARKAMQQKMKEDFNLEITEEQAADLCDIATINEKMDMSKADMGDVIKDFQKSDAPQFAGKSDEKRRQMAIAAKLQADRGGKKTYREFVELLAPQIHEGSEDENVVDMAENAFDYKSNKAPASSGRYDVKQVGNRTIVTRKYNPDTGHSTGTDDDEKPAAEKRGRGRPAGSTSGAKQKGSGNKSDYRGIDRTTHALHLPRK